MFDTNDIELLRGMFKEQDSRLLNAIKENNHDLKKEIRDEIHALITASEKRIVTEISELLDTAVLPQITELQTDMATVKQHLHLA